MIIYSNKEHSVPVIKGYFGDEVMILESGSTDSIINVAPVLIILDEEFNYEKKNNNQLVIKCSQSVELVTTISENKNVDILLPKKMFIGEIGQYYKNLNFVDFDKYFEVYDFDYFFNDHQVIESLISNIELSKGYNVAVYPSSLSELLINLLYAKFDYVLPNNGIEYAKLQSSNYIRNTFYINSSASVSLNKRKRTGDTILREDCDVSYSFSDKRDNNFQYFDRVINCDLKIGNCLSKDDVISNDVEYKYLPNGTKRLCVVFGSHATLTHMKASYGDSNYENELSYYHKKYELGMCMFGKSWDYLVINDDNNNFAGWHIVDGGKVTTGKYQKLINKIISLKGYHSDNIIFFGSSKGGYGALLHGILNNNIKNIFALVPQIEVKPYILKNMEVNNVTPSMKTMYNATIINNELFDKLDKEVYSMNKQDKKISIFVSRIDESFENIIKFKDENVDVYVTKEDIAHGDFVIRTWGTTIELFNSIIQNITKKEGERYFLYEDKGEM